MEAILKAIEKNDRMLEIGCGTGCVSISIALEYNDVKVDSVDISDFAIENTFKKYSKI